jgi:hypothetical protein
MRRQTGGDELYLQQQNFSLSALAKRDAKPDPFAKTPSEAPASTPSTPAPAKSIDEPEVDIVASVGEMFLKAMAA